MPLFSIPLSGLTASTTAMSTIANNLANLNTTGYKAGSTQFQDLFYQQLGTNGAGNPIQVGGGTQVSSTSINMTSGNTSSTGVRTDAAINGDGFFIVQDQNGGTSYTRDGSFQVQDGHLETQNGEYVMGYPAVNGVVPPGVALTALQLDTGQINPPAVTTSMNMTANLSASAIEGDNSLSYPIPIYDSLGVEHIVNFSFTRSATDLSGNSTWTAAVLIPNADVSAPGGSTDAWTSGKDYADGNMIFDATTGHTYECIKGGTAGATAPVWPTDGSTVSETGGPQWRDMGTNTVLTTVTLTFDSTGALTAVNSGSPNGSVAITSGALKDGANSLQFAWKMSDSSGNPLLGQVAGSSTVATYSQNGYGAGTLVDYSIQDDGTILGKFSNNQTSALGQIALANFANVQGLERDGDNNYSATLSSGGAVVGVAGTGGRGTLKGGALELSNVDIATEFSNLIIAQRGYEANARTVTTFDQIMQDTINLKQA